MTIYQIISLFLMAVFTGWTLIKMYYKEGIYLWKFIIVVISIINFVVSMTGLKL